MGSDRALRSGRMPGPWPLPGLACMGLLLSGCSPWVWRVADLRYASGEAQVPVFSSMDGAEVSPEAFAVGSAVLTGRSMDELLARAGEEGRLHGADAVVLQDFEAVAAHWTATYSPAVVGDEVHREESVDISSATATIRVTGLRNPAHCVGATTFCDVLPGQEGCPVRVGRVVPGGPADAAGIRGGNLVVAIGGEPARHGWDVHQRVEEAGTRGGSISLQISEPGGMRTVDLRPIPCDVLYPPASGAGPEPSPG